MDQQTKSKPNLWMMTTLVLAGVIIGFGISQIPYFKGINTQVATIKQEPPARNENTGKNNAANDKKAGLSQEQIDKLVDDDPVDGDPKAPVTIVEFSDFQCPYCARFAQMTMSAVVENYVKSGKVKVVFRDFPLEGHPNAMPAAFAADCANDQGKFWKMHDTLFDQQSEWSSSEKVGDLFKRYAKELGLDAKQFNECYTSQKHASEIRKDLIDGVSVGVNGTPAFFVNGKAVSGAMPYDIVVKPIIEAELAGKQWELQFAPNGQPSVKVF